MNKLLENLEKYVIYSVVFLFPIAFAPISPNPFVPAKLALLVYGLGLALIIKSLRTILSGKFTWSVSIVDFPVFLIAIAFITSTYVQKPNLIEALLLPGTTTGLVSGVLLYFLLQQREQKEKRILSMILLSSGVIYALFMFGSSLGIFASFKFLPTFMKSTLFSPGGNYLSSAIFLGTLLPIGIMRTLNQKNIAKKGLLGISNVIILFGLGLSIFNLLPGQAPNNVAIYRSPGHTTSWAIAVESLKASPLIGNGPGSYLTAFNRFRPASYNDTENWRLKFGSASSHYMTVLTETGMLGIAGFILLAFGTYRFVIKETKDKESLKDMARNVGPLFSLCTLLILLLFLPASLLVSTLLFVYLSLSIHSKKTTLHLASKGDSSQSKLPALILTVPIILGVGFVFFKAAGYISAEYTFKKAIDAIGQNNGKDAYDTLKLAIEKNGQVDRYHASYSQVNLALANSLAAQAQNGELTEETKSQITTLVQQSIREARFTVILNPNRAGNWEILARTYKSIIPLAKGADVFASQSYRQAVSLDPTNANLRILWGQVHYAGRDYDTAVDIFRSATQIKPDLANAYFNLAFALREQGNISAAKQAMTVVIANVETGTPDYEAAQKALTDLENLEILQVPEETVTLDAPQEGEEPILDEPVELTAEDEPPITPTQTSATDGEETTPNPEVSPLPTITP